MEDSAQPTTHLQPVVRLRMSGVIPPLSICLHGIHRKTLPLLFLAAMHCILLDGRINGYTDNNISVKH